LVGRGVLVGVGVGAARKGRLEQPLRLVTAKIVQRITVKFLIFISSP
jgi:hypothetical protein